MSKNNHEKTIKQFNEWAESYEEGLWGRYFAKSNRYIYQLLKRNVDPSASILDVGCGTGGLISLLSSHFLGRIVGVDISSEMIRLARAKVKNENVMFIHSDIEDADFGVQEFDAVICMNSFHHYINHKEAVRGITKHIKKGGLFILLDPITDNPVRKIWVFILNSFFGEKNVKYFSKKDLNSLVLSEGFKINTQKPYMYFALLSVFKKEA